MAEPGKTIAPVAKDLGINETTLVGWFPRLVGPAQGCASSDLERLRRGTDYEPERDPQLREVCARRLPAARLCLPVVSRRCAIRADRSAAVYG